MVLRYSKDKNDFKPTTETQSNLQILVDNILEMRNSKNKDVTYPVLFGQMVTKDRSPNDNSHAMTSQGDYHTDFQHTGYVLGGKLDQSYISPEEVFYSIIKGEENGYREFTHGTANSVK